MTREIIEGAKEVVIPYIMEELRHFNVDGNGEADAEEARKDLEEIFSLAIKALEQKPFKPMVEIDLDYVIKQKYIEREALDKIRAEIERLPITDTAVRLVTEIIDKYKAESEEA